MKTISDTKIQTYFNHTFNL